MVLDWGVAPVAGSGGPRGLVNGTDGDHGDGAARRGEGPARADV